MTLPPLNFADFEAAPPLCYEGDPLWKTRMFRMAAYLGGRVATDAAQLGGRVTLYAAQQFTRSIGSISANLAEGYSRAGTADQLRFYGYALGSLRESLAWLSQFDPSSPLPREEYFDLLVQIRRQLLTAMRIMREQDAKAEGRRPKGHRPKPHRRQSKS